MKFRFNKVLKALTLSTSLACSPSLLANVNQETTEVEMRFNLPSSTASDGAFKAREQFNIADESTYDFKTSVNIFDAKGRPLTQTFYFLKDSATEWLIATSVNGVSIDFLANDGNAAASNSPNALGSTETGITIAGRMIFDNQGRITDVYAGDNQPVSGANANKISTAALGAEVVSSSEDADQKITLNFNVGNNEFFVKPTHFDYDFTVWKWEVDGSTDNPLNIEIEEITGAIENDQFALSEKLEPVAINNNSEVALNVDISSNTAPSKIFNGVYRFRDGTLKTITHRHTPVELIDLNDNGEMVGTKSTGSTASFFYQPFNISTQYPTFSNLLDGRATKVYALNNRKQVVVGISGTRDEVV